MSSFAYSLAEENWRARLGAGSGERGMKPGVLGARLEDRARRTGYGAPPRPRQAAARRFGEGVFAAPAPAISRVNDEDEPALK